MQSPGQSSNQLQRIRIFYGLLIFLCLVFIVRLFYLQVIKHDYYQKVASSFQHKEKEIPAERGPILVHSGSQTTPLALNETLYTLFADPKYVKDINETAQKIQKTIGGSLEDYEKAMNTDSRYAVLAKKLSRAQKDQVAKIKLKGIGTREAVYRTYPQGKLAAQLLGFVDDNGAGKYGLEQALNKELKGVAGELKAITDAQGIPLASNKDNFAKSPHESKQTSCCWQYNFTMSKM